ncbi:MAG: DUF2306 domain-containing protein [Aureliella sp.]
MHDFQLSLRSSRLYAVAVIVASVLLLKVFLSILYQYQWYFPADFSSEFLSGREASFHGAYRAAFYAHIVSAPLTLIVGLFLLFSGHDLLRFDRYRAAHIHRFAGRVQAAIVLLVVVPSGFVMARHAFAGPIAGTGLAALSAATAGCIIMAVHYACKGELHLHRSWATRSCILLGSPLLLRLISGVVLLLQLEPTTCYRFSAWVSWLIPLGSYELWRHYLTQAGVEGLIRTQNEVPE